MELHPNREPQAGKVVHCSDCGSSYRVAQEALSSKCPACGNIEFFGRAKAGRAPQVKNIFGEWQEFTQKKLEPVAIAAESPLRRFFKPVNGVQAEEILFRYQVEWQLWAAVVQNFADPEYHGAYISLLGSTLEFDQGISRYQAHSRAMASAPDGEWQMQVCDRMLSQIQEVAVVQGERALQRRPGVLELFPRPLLLFLAFSLGLIVVLSGLGWRFFGMS